MKKHRATMQEVLKQYQSLQQNPKRVKVNQNTPPSSPSTHQPKGMDAWLEMYPPRTKKQEDEYDPSRHQKVNNLKAERELDLHGMTWQEAERSMNLFLHRAQSDGIIAVRIIHGKGNRSQIQGGVLKPKVISYLQQDKRVKKVNQSGFKDGQSGACHVIIKLKSV